MRKSNFVSLANLIREHNSKMLAIFGRNAGRMMFSAEEITLLADWCESQAKPYRGTDGKLKPGFKREEWIALCNGTPVCTRCRLSITDPEMMSEAKGYRHVNACPIG